MDNPKTIDQAMSAGDAGSLVIENVLSLAGAVNNQFMDRTKTKQSDNNLTPVGNIKAEFVDVPDDFLSQVDLKAEPIEPLDIKNLQLGSLINASNPGGWSSGSTAVKHEPGQHSRELTNCLIPKVEPKVEGASHFQTVGHLQNFPRLINGEIRDQIFEPGEVNVRSVVGERLSLFELMSQSRDQKHLSNDIQSVQSKERKPVDPDLKSSVHDSMSLELSQMLLPTQSKSSEIISNSMTIQRKPKKVQCARKSTVSRKVKESRSRTMPVNKDTDRSSHGIDEDTEGYEIDSDSDSDVLQVQLRRKNAENHDGVADVETEKQQTESVPTIPSKPQTNQFKNNKRGRTGRKARRKQPTKRADKNNEHIPERILRHSAAKINGRKLNEDVINPTQTDQSYQNRTTRSFNRHNLSQHVNNREKQLEQDGGEVEIMADSMGKTVDRSRKSRSKQKPENADANSNSRERRTKRSLKKSEHPRQMDQSDLEEDVNQNETVARQTRSSARKVTLTRSKKKTPEDETSDSENSVGIDSVTSIRKNKRSTARKKFPRKERRGSDTESNVSESESDSQAGLKASSSTGNKRSNSRKIRTGKRKVSISASGDSFSESSSDTDVKRVVTKTPTRRKRKRRKLLPERSSPSNNESGTDTESNAAEVRKKKLRHRKKRKQKDYTSSGSDGENEENPDSDFESEPKSSHDEPKSRKLKKGSRKSRMKGQLLSIDSESEAESEALPSKQIGPHKVKSSSVRLGRKARSSADSEVSDERNTDSESDDTLTNQSDSRSSRKKNEGRHVSKGNTTDHSDSSENDSDDTNRSEQVSLRSKRNTSGHKRPKQKEVSSDSSEDDKASSVLDSVVMLSDDESTGTIYASPGCSLEEKYASDVRFQPFVQLEPLPDILEMEQLPPTTPITRNVKNDFQTSKRKSNSSKKKVAKTPDVVELVDIDDSGSEIVGQSDDNEVIYEPPTPQVLDEELEFLTAASYGIYSSRARRLASMRLANYAMAALRKKRETRSTEGSVITLAENSEWEGSEVGDNVQSEETNDSQYGNAKEKSQSNDQVKSIELNDKAIVETAEQDTTTKQVPVKSKWAHKYKRTTCKVCLKEFASTTTHNRHFQSVHAGMRPFICKFCGKGFVRKDGLKSHISVHTDERPYVCKLCGKAYKQVAHLNEHMTCSHDGKRNFICSFCGMGFISNYKLNIHVRIHTGEKPFECEICHKRFAQKSTLDSHSVTHSTERPFICQQCGKGYKAKNLLKVHMATHSDVRNYKCKICPLAFKWQQSLRDHMQNHNDERNFPCEICNFSFRRKRQLQQHMYIHSDEKQFSCDICSKKFRYRKSLTTHMQIHVGEKKFECDLCHKRFYTNSRLKQHKFLHTGKRPYACKVCEQRFKTTGGVSQHMMCMHPEEEMERRKTNAVGWLCVDP